MNLGSNDPIVNQEQGKDMLKDEPPCYLDQVVASEGLEV